MANSQTFASSNGQTTLSHIQGSGLAIPPRYIGDRSAGKLEELFLFRNNSDVIYDTSGILDTYGKGVIATRFDYKNPNTGQKNIAGKNSPLLQRIAREDTSLVRDYIDSNSGRKHQLKQLVLQGFQQFDETKVYNPYSPILSAAFHSSFGLLDRPTRHVDTSNILTGVIGAAGLGGITSLVGGVFGKGPAIPSAPRSTVASKASQGLGFSTLTSLVGGADRSEEVLPRSAPAGSRGLLRGNTATTAYNGAYYSKLLSGGDGSLLSRLLSSVGKTIQNKTLVGGILPPKQPWDADYRADESTYNLYLKNGLKFSIDPNRKIDGKMTGLLNSLGFGEKRNYSLSVSQRFYGKSDLKPNPSRLIVTGNDDLSRKNSSTKKVGQRSTSPGSQVTRKEIIDFETDDALKYSDVFNKKDKEIEISDQLLNYKIFTDPSNDKGFNNSQYNDETQIVTDDIVDNFKSVLRKISDNGEKYEYFAPDERNQIPLQFSKFDQDLIGMDSLRNIDSKNITQDSNNYTQAGRQIRSEENGGFPSLNLTKNGRKIRPTHDVDYVNSLDVIDKVTFDKKYNTNTPYGSDVIRFYFYDVVNEKFIPFNATITGLDESNHATWEPVQYLGRADKLYNYTGFTRTVAFSFKAVAHSIKELLPMWKRINYLTGLTRPANYTQKENGGYMVPPLVQLRLGDFYKNHNIIITECNLSIPDDASWETLPESYDGNWFYGVSKAFTWRNQDNQRGHAQFPREANIRIQMNILEKVLPRTGDNLWGDVENSEKLIFSNRLGIENFNNNSDDLKNVGPSTAEGGSYDFMHRFEFVGPGGQG